MSAYHAGGAAATFADHPDEYEYALARVIEAGTAACYRGPTLYDDATPEGARAKAALKRWVGFYKAHRSTLIEPVVHLRRPDMQGWDGWLHVGPPGGARAGGGGDEAGVALVFNPTGMPLNATVRLPLYYTGVHDVALVSIDEAPPASHNVARDFSLALPLRMRPRSVTTVVVSDGAPRRFT